MEFLHIRCISFDVQHFAIDFKGIYSVFKILGEMKLHVSSI